jgi:DNA-binding GntR family transcriptional regulator
VEPPKFPTHVERVYAELRADILAGRRRPGSKLRFSELTAGHQASMGVVREAVSRLVAEELVESMPQQGTRVKPLSIADLEHLTEARREVEATVLRHAVRTGDIDWESRVVAAHHRLARTPQMDSADPQRIGEDWAHAHRELHEVILEGCTNPRLVAIAKGLRASAELYRRWSVPLGSTGRDVAAEHRALVDAIVARDAEEAVRLAAAHIDATTRQLLEGAGLDADDPGLEAVR